MVEKRIRSKFKRTFFVRDWIESKGYDSIAYNNDFELGNKLYRL